MGEFQGYCWPGNSVWIDYLNGRARDFWSSLYSYDIFNGTSSLFHIWNDMNEPSVFSEREGTLPKTAKHMLDDKDGTIVMHRDVHNAYGVFMTRASYNGILRREKKIDERIRPFILTRSSYFGTQKYAAKWTGDN